nr:suppressor of mek1 [Colletotrichum truncatum]KAF6799687.1 suppressor of mek1 [Colletotrichum truncatum]
MMAQPVPHHATDKKRVKVYELRNNDWFDRGTGFCTAAFMQTEDGQPRDPRVIVESEDHPDRLLLETKICKEDGFQKQQGKSPTATRCGATRLTWETETLIVWTEPSNGIDMALSFQEADGCALIWKFVNSVQQTFQGGMVAAGGSRVIGQSLDTVDSDAAATDDSLSDDLAMEMPSTVSLPPAEIGNLQEIETSMRIMSQTAGGRDALAKCIMGDNYIGRLIPLVEMAEDLESLPDLHRLCNIMKTVILLNDTAIIEHAVSDECVIGVVGALEYDPDFPSHKANHRHWLGNQGRYKEVVPIEDEQIRRKIHQTYRLQYLKDVVLARILDDPTFSVLNSLIFFNQVDIVQHLQGNAGFLNELFSVFKATQPDQKRKKDAVIFIQQCCAIAKNLQPPARQTLFTNFLHHGLLQVINFGLRHSDVGVRVGATDILVALIDHDPQLIRHTIYRQLQERQPPLTDSLIDLLLVEVDLGVKSQISDALKVLLDMPPQMSQEVFTKANGEYVNSVRRSGDVQQDVYINSFYSTSATRLFKPLMDLYGRTDMKFPVQQASMFTYLIEILCFFIRQHGNRSKTFILEQDIFRRIAQLLACPEKYLRLVAIRFFRHLAALQDPFYDKHIMEHGILEPLLQLVSQSMPRDNLLSSACVEFFVFINGHENKKDYAKFLVQNYRDQLVELSYVDTFKSIVTNYDQTQGFTLDLYNESEEDHARRMANPHARLAEQLPVDSEQDEYFNTSDDDENPEGQAFEKLHPTNGSAASTPGSKPLVDYSSDEEADENVDPEVLPTSGEKQEGADGASDTSSESSSVAPPERLSEKRRREEDDDDELGKMMQNKRRNSSSAGSNASMTSGMVRRKKSFADRSNSAAPKKIAISISPSVKTGGAARSDDES